MIELPENSQLDVYIVQKDTPSPEYQRPFPLMEGPIIHPYSIPEYGEQAFIMNKLKDTGKVYSVTLSGPRYRYISHMKLWQNRIICQHIKVTFSNYKTTRVEMKMMIHLIISFVFRIKITSTSCSS